LVVFLQDSFLLQNASLFLKIFFTYDGDINLADELQVKLFTTKKLNSIFFVYSLSVNKHFALHQPHTKMSCRRSFCTKGAVQAACGETICYMFEVYQKPSGSGRLVTRFICKDLSKP